MKDDSKIPQTGDSALEYDSNGQRPSFGKCVADCALDHYGLTGLLARGGVGAASIPFPQSWIGAPTVLGASPDTNLFSALGHSFPSLNARIGVRILGTPRVLGILGRAMPGVGMGLLA
jgi:hypothetical protein